MLTELLKKTLSGLRLVTDTDNETGNMPPCLINCCIWSWDPLLVTLSHLARHVQPWVGSQGRGGAAWSCSGRLRGTGSLGKLSFSSNSGVRCFRQQLRELDHGFKLSHSWMLSKSCSWYGSPLFWPCFRLRRCVTCWTCFLMAQCRLALTWLHYGNFQF